MRHRTRIGLAAIVLLVTAAGGYTAFWFAAAGRLQSGIDRLAAALRTHQIDLTWRTIDTAGFPFAFRLDLTGVEFRDRAPVAASVIRVPRLSAGASPWNLAVWRLAAPEGIAARAGNDQSPTTALSAPTATADILLGTAGGLTARLDLDDPQAYAGAPLAAQHAALWLVMPAQPPQGDSDPAFGFAFDAWRLTLPTAPKPFHNPLDELAAALTVRGKLPTTPPRQAATSWRDGGGTADVDHFALRWDRLKVSGSGTFALDGNLQPEGSFSVAVENYPALLQAFVAAGQLTDTEAVIANLALMLLAKSGPDGEPQIAAPFRMQNGRMFLGPARLGSAPHISW
jgi:hypothetical protein